MAYKRPQHLGTHGERRVLGILTLTNIIAGLIGLAGLWVLSGLLGLGGDRAFTAGWLVRIGLAAAGASMGVVATLRWTGLSLWDRVVLWGGFQLRRATGQTHRAPPAPARIATTRGIAPLLQDGKVIAEVYDPTEEYALTQEGDDAH